MRHAEGGTTEVSQVVTYVTSHYDLRYFVEAQYDVFF